MILFLVIINGSEGIALDSTNYEKIPNIKRTCLVQNKIVLKLTNVRIYFILNTAELHDVEKKM